MKESYKSGGKPISRRGLNKGPLEVPVSQMMAKRTTRRGHPAVTILSRIVVLQRRLPRGEIAQLKP